MAHPVSPPRIRGINFLLGGTLTACALVAFALLSGTIDLGIGAPEVRIDAAGPTWPQYPE